MTTCTCTNRPRKNGSPRGAMLVEIPFAICLLALVLIAMVRFAAIGSDAAARLIAADAQMKREWTP
ncbi:MAG: hypothetical protein HY543_06125 [Deltaproteobacteria bacterium]|nr:hypothetical protein [Deltaproteobacteria bacterium]